MAYLDFNIEDHLFKDANYFYLYKHVKVDEGSLNIIRQPSLRFTPPSKFNDPFDCSFSVNSKIKYSIKQLRERFSDRISKRNVGNWIKAQKRIEQVFLHKDFYKDFHSNIGVCCLNQNPLSLLMWSHYADFHKGFMVELRFHIDSSRLNANFIPFRVRYSDNYPLIDMATTNQEPEKDVERTIFTKSLEWGYEKEFRIVGVEKPGVIEEYPSEYLSSVILGVNISPNNIKLIKKQLDLFNSKFRKGLTRVELYSAKKVKGMYKINVPKHPRLN